jgi:SAM-dependent methyltransferase/uncharacterized protein YbaR (Trm112 family)
VADESMLACPTCDTPLTPQDSGHFCRTCNTQYANLNGLPWLFSEPVYARSDWRNRWQYALADLDNRAATHRTPLSKTLADTTRGRLKRMADACEQQIEILNTLLQPLDISQPVARETYLALRSRLPTTVGLLSYEANVHRDWCWGDDENRACAEAVLDLIATPSPRVLVLGAGGGRLAYDLHQQLKGQTYALDANPLYGLLAQQMWKGDTVEYFEFPLAPRNTEHSAVRQTLKAPAPSEPGLHYVLADALRPPFSPGMFDVVVTPWLLDILPTPSGQLITLINSLLRAGGSWIYQGSIAFAHANPVHNLTLDELLETASGCGFETGSVNEMEVPYLASPLSRHSRRELLTTLSTTKCRNVPRQPRHQHLPEWIVQSGKPVPVLPAFRTQLTTTRVNAYIMGLIDGKRTVQEMAQVLEDQRLMPAKDAETAIRGFLSKMWEEAEGLTGLS